MQCNVCIDTGPPVLNGNGSTLLAPQMGLILASLTRLNSVVSAADRIQRGLKLVASVGIRTQTSARSLDQIVCPRDLTHQPKLMH